VSVRHADPGCPAIAGPLNLERMARCTAERENREGSARPEEEPAAAAERAPVGLDRTELACQVGSNPAQRAARGELRATS
jgi:hypothetical protein